MQFIIANNPPRPSDAEFDHRRIAEFGDLGQVVIWILLGAKAKLGRTTS